MASTILIRLSKIYEMPGDANRFASMEGLRGLAVLLVFFVHLDSVFGVYLHPHSLMHAVFYFLGVIGNSGVDVFFVLSGFLIYGALIRKKVDFFQFMRRRYERIYPTFLSVFALYLILSAVLPSENKIHGTPIRALLYIGANLLLLPGMFSINPIITVAWSLSYEMFFYLAIPLLIILGMMRHWTRGCRVLFFMGLTAASIVSTFYVAGVHLQILTFVVGILLYEAISSHCVGPSLEWRGEILSILLFLASLVFVYFAQAHPWSLKFLANIQQRSATTRHSRSMLALYYFLAVSVPCFLLVLYSLANDGMLKKLFSWKPLRYLGNMSYSYYLIHGLTLNAFAFLAYRVVPPTHTSSLFFSLMAFTAFLGTIVTSTMLFHFVEMPYSIWTKPSMRISAVLPGSVTRPAIRQSSNSRLEEQHGRSN